MSDFTHARVCIRHGGGSVEIQAPAGEVTFLDLSGPRAPAASGPWPKAGKARLAVFALACCAAGVAMTLLVASRPVTLASSDTFPDRFAGPPSAPFAMPAVPVQQPPASAGTGSGTDPFGLRSR